MINSGRTIILWGAGATASLGIQTTAQQTRTLQVLASKRERRPLAQRVEGALGDKAKEPWISALADLLIILGDGDDNPKTEEEAIVGVSPHNLHVMRAHWRPGASDDDLRSRVVALRTLYDWRALKAVIEVCPAATTYGMTSHTRDVVQDESFQLNDLFNVLDMHGHSGHGFRVKEGEFLTPQRVLGARNALKMLQQTMLYIDWQYGRVAKREELDLHYDFAEALCRRMQRQGLELAGRDVRFDSRDFYMGDVGFACLNWDPVAIWCQFVANRNLNRSPPHVGSPARKLQVYHDLGHFVSGPRVEDRGRPADTPWHPMNESSALRLNDEDHGSCDRIRISKFLLPHGCLWWRECPNCGKLSSYMGDAWEWDSPTLIPPPPLRAFASEGMFRARDKEGEAWDRGEVDARACVHCRTLTYAHHTQTVMQSSFKSPPPPFLDEIKRDLRVEVQNADHIVLMGYTLPQDDVDYRAFLAARRQRKGVVRCSVVVGRDWPGQWFSPSEWPAMSSRMPHGMAPRTTLEVASELFGACNVRFYGGGIPNVFLSGGSVTDAAVEQLLTWEEE